MYVDLNLRQGLTLPLLGPVRKQPLVFSYSIYLLENSNLGCLAYRVKQPNPGRTNSVLIRAAHLHPSMCSEHLVDGVGVLRAAGIGLIVGDDENQPPLCVGHDVDMLG